jgi:Holliday junction resolvase
MATSLETQLVHAFQVYFDGNDIKAVAYRYRQLMWCGQFTDIAIDSKIPQYYLGIECKSIQTKKLYFTSHFQPEQINNMNIFLDISGRKGYLALEFRHRGTKSEGYLIPWEHVLTKISNNDPGISKSEVLDFDGLITLTRIKNAYVIPEF